ncbi:MAG: hypothetical protein ABIA04_09185 [Pseudomonadota bacterium]
MGRIRRDTKKQTTSASSKDKKFDPNTLRMYNLKMYLDFYAGKIYEKNPPSIAISTKNTKEK